MIKQRYVVFELPFPLLLPDSMGADPDADFAPEIFVSGTPPAGIKTALMSRGGGGFQAWGELEGGDPYGRVSYTRLQVRFNGDVSPEVLSWSTDTLLAAAVDRANALVIHYRDLANQPVLAELSVPDLVHFWVVEEGPDQPPSTLTVGRGRGPLRTGIGQEQLAIDAELRRRVGSGSEVPFLRAVELNIHRHLTGAEYRLAVIESAVFFEAWLKRILQKRFRDAGLSEAATQAKFRDRQGQPRTIWAIAKHLVPDAFNVDFISTAEGLAWSAHVKDARNLLVHGVKEQATKAEAEAAYSAVLAACKFVQHAADAV